MGDVQIWAEGMTEPQCAYFPSRCIEGKKSDDFKVGMLQFFLCFLSVSDTGKEKNIKKA